MCQVLASAVINQLNLGFKYYFMLVFLRINYIFYTGKGYRLVYLIGDLLSVWSRQLKGVSVEIISISKMKHNFCVGEGLGGFT